VFLPRIVAAGYAGVASPDLGDLRSAVEALPPEQRAAYYAGFLDGPSWEDKPVWPTDEEWSDTLAEAGPKEGQA